MSMNPKKQLLAAALIFSFVGATMAITPSEVHSLSDRYNSQLEEAPGFLKALVGNQRINLHVESPENETLDDSTFGINMSQAVLSGVQDGGFDNPTLEVWVEDQDITTVADSRNPLNMTSNLMKEDKIRYRSHGIINSIRMAFAALFF